MKRRTATILSAVFAVSMISAVSASAASMGGLNTSYGGVIQASGSAITHLGNGQVAVDVSYVDRRANGYSTYAKVYFYKKGAWVCVGHHPAGSDGIVVAQRSLPNINYAAGWRTVHQAISVTGPVQNYGARYSVCVDVLGMDPCNITDLVKF